MLQIDRATIDALNAATSADDLVESVQQAIRLEFATIPPYLTAMLSLRPGENRDIWWAIHDVVVDEMLHMLIGCNLVNALGGRPALDGTDFVPDYPSTLPLGIGSGLSVGLERFSLEVVERTFMEIEEPEEPLVFPGAAAEVVAPEFATIGEFYRTLSDMIGGIEGLVLGSEPRQVVDPRWYPAGRLFPILDVHSAQDAISLIVGEGEGTPTSPIDPDGDVAHYYRFQAITKGHRLIRNDAVPEGFSFTGDPYLFDEAGVWPIVANQHRHPLETGTEAWRRAQQFQVVFTRLLASLQRVVDGEPTHLDAAMGLMFELKLAGQALVAQPVVEGGVPTGPHAGPVFRRALVNA